MSQIKTDFAWLAEHSLEISEQYKGKWIAVCDGRVVASGDTAAEAERKARLQYPDEPIILQAIDPETDVIYAGA